MSTAQTYSRIVGTGSYLPAMIRTNTDLEKMIDTTDQWITERTGIKQRHVAAADESSSSMAAIATLNALEMAGLKPNDIDMIIVATCSPDKIFPSAACHLQQRLGITNRCPAFDVAAACAGFSHALAIADNFIKTGAMRTVLVAGAEMLSRVIDWQDRGTCVLFGDGAGAVILTASEEPGIYSTKLQADSAYIDKLFMNNLRVHPVENASPYLQMEGSDVFKVAVRMLGELVTTTLQANGFEKTDLQWLIPHQANIRIIQAVADKLDLPLEKVVVTIDKHGNTSSASIPLALDVAVRDGRVKRGDLILLESFGGGFAFGSALVRF